MNGEGELELPLGREAVPEPETASAPAGPGRRADSHRDLDGDGAAGEDLVFTRRELLAVWYLPLLAGALPALLLGFGYSAIADRIVFVFWGLALAAGWVALLRHGLAAGWPAARRWGSLLLLAAAGAAVFGGLERRHHEILDLGFRAVLPGLYTPAATRPATALALAAALAAAGALAALALRRRA